MRKSSLAGGQDTPIEKFYGIGQKRAEAFHKLGLFTARDLLFHFPRAYEPRGNVKTTVDAIDGEVCSLILTVSAEPKTAMIRRGMVLTKLVAFDEEGRCQITFFNQPYVRDVMHRGATFRFFGKVERRGFDTVSMSSPVYEPVSDAVPLRPLVPVYPLTDGISQKLMGATIREALRTCGVPDKIDDPLPLSLREKFRLLPRGTALAQIHAPQNTAEMEAARRRLAFEELFFFAASSLYFGKEKKRLAETPIPAPGRAQFLSLLPYRLTAAQTRTLDELDGDFVSGTLMNRLLVGDVGSGKTVCAAYAIYAALSAGRQAALMAPTEILARQHFADLSPMFEALGYRVALLVGSTTAAQKRRVNDGLLVGSVDLVIGTHALIEPTVVFCRLGLVVVDEQHRFGAAQRTALAEKSRSVHLLSMSATPIPRTLAMVLYCDTDVSILDEMPPGRQKVDTFCVGEAYRARLNAFIRKQVAEGGQVYLVCPAVEEEKLESESGELLSASSLLSICPQENEEKPKMKAAVDFAKELSEQVFPDLRVAFVHGKLTGKAKEAVMNEFAAGNTDILVSTTVIEVGVNVPRATLMIVENAEFFGLSALHQLRGRVGRGERKSYCVLVSDSKSEKARERLGLLCETNDGFRIAEKDLAMRGPGDFIAQSGGKIRQSGEFDLGLASMEGDARMLYAAFDEAKRLIGEDPGLSSPENAALLAELTRKRKIE